MKGDTWQLPSSFYYLLAATKLEFSNFTLTKDRKSDPKFTNKLAPYGTDGRLFATYVSVNFKVTWHKNYDKYKKSVFGEGVGDLLIAVIYITSIQLQQNKTRRRPDVTVLARRVVSAARPTTRTCPAAGQLPTCPAAGPPARRQRYRRQTTTTDDSVQNTTGPLGGPVVKEIHNKMVSRLRPTGV